MNLYYKINLSSKIKIMMKSYKELLEIAMIIIYTLLEIFFYLLKMIKKENYNKYLKRQLLLELFLLSYYNLLIFMLLGHLINLKSALMKV